MRLLFVDQTTGHNPLKINEKPTGGTLTSLTLIPEYLASKGHDVYVMSTFGHHEDINGVHYIDDKENIPIWDVVVFNRNVLPKDFIEYNRQINAKIIWWLHDIVDLRYLKDDSYKYVTHIVALSDYCKKTFSDFYEIPQDKFSVIPNGVDKKLFYPGKYEDRNPNLYIMASALIKGFIPIEAVHNNLERLNPNLDLRIYSNQALHNLTNSPVQEGFLNAMRDKGASVYQPVSQPVLAGIMRKAWCLLMPNSYPEICSNLLLQARASGLPVLTSDIGANPEFIENNVTGAMTTKFKPIDNYSWIVEYARLACALYVNKEAHKKISENAPNGVKSWDEIGEEWNVLLQNVVG